MRIFGMCLKYGPWRSSLKEAYEDLRSSSGLSSVVRLSRAEFCLEVLRKLCKSMHGVVHDAWIENVGRRIGFCSGPVPFLTSLGVIKKRSSKGQGGWVLGKDTTRRKQLCNSRFEKRAALAKIERWMTFAEVVASHTAPRTCTQWVHSFHSLLATLRGGIVVRSLGEGQCHVVAAGFAIMSPGVRLLVVLGRAAMTSCNRVVGAWRQSSRWRHDIVPPFFAEVVRW